MKIFQQYDFTVSISVVTYYAVLSCHSMAGEIAIAWHIIIVLLSRRNIVRSTKGTLVV